MTRTIAAQDLQQTLVATAPLILTGLAVAFAFRAGLFNIGAQGQYTVGSVIAVWVATSFTHMNPVLHIILAVVAGCTHRRAAWAAIAGWLKAVGRDTRGDLDDHAQLDRDLGCDVPVPGGRTASGPDTALGNPVSKTIVRATCICR